MEKNYRQLWADCLSLIKERVNNERVYNTWFADIRIESYDVVNNVVTLSVPSKYVFEYLEMYCIKLLRWALVSSFGDNVGLKYIILSEPSFADVASYLKKCGFDSLRDQCNISIDNAKKRMEDGLKYFLKGKEMKWLPAYDKVSEWLTNNEGRGLLVVGTPGMGKTLLCQKVLPVILGNCCRPIASVNACELHGRLEELKKERIVIIDDLGKEPRKYYGDTDNSFFELCNHAEKTSSLLIITTNLSTTPVPKDNPCSKLYSDSIQQRYGVEVLDRLRCITKMARFEGRSLRA